MNQHIWACTCGTETVCEPKDQALGAVFQCPGCEKVWGAVKSPVRGMVWAAIAASDVKFHRLLEKEEEAA
jgi:hypothetical protein